LQWPKATLAAAGLLLVATLWPLAQLGSEFLPQIDEGDLLYMPSTLPGISSREAGRLLQQTDRLIRDFLKCKAYSARPDGRIAPPTRRR
jgi:Cu(I)/Ag(I) efflux system membrane protein CusA/SilA